VYGYDTETKQQSSHIDKQPLSLHSKTSLWKHEEHAVPVAIRSTANQLLGL